MLKNDTKQNVNPRVHGFPSSASAAAMARTRTSSPRRVFDFRRSSLWGLQNKQPARWCFAFRRL